MSCWQENLELLKKGAPGVYNILVNSEEEKATLTVKWNDKKRMLQVKEDNKEIWLGSTFDTSRETAKLLEACDEDAGLVIVLGIGNYKVFREMKKHFKNIRRIIIFEPSREIFKTFAENVSMRKTFSIFSNIDISFIISDDVGRMQNAFLTYVSEFQSDSTAVVRSIAYSQLFGGIAVRMEVFIKRYDTSKGVNINTIKHFYHVWLVNQWRNLSTYSLNAVSMKDLMTQLPVIVVSAGPSLKNNLHLLKNVGNRAIIIAVGSAIQILDKNGIIPHLRMALDGGALEERVFYGINSEECPLLYSSSLYYQTLREYGSKRIEFFTHKGDVLVEYIYRLFKIAPPSCSSGASVANTAVFLALYLGCQKIVLMGQDLCFTDDKMHAEGTWLSQKGNVDMAQMRNRLLTKDIYGNEVYTDDSFLAMKKTLEDASNWYKNTRFINASEGGLRLENYEHKRLSAVIEGELPLEDTIDIRSVLQDRINSFYDSQEEKNRELFIKEGVKIVQKVFEKFKKEIEELLLLVEEMPKSKIKQIDKNFNQICNSNDYKLLIGNIFSSEVVAVYSSLKEKDLNRLNEALLTFIEYFSEYVKLSLIFAEEFLAGEDKFDLILGV